MIETHLDHQINIKFYAKISKSAIETLALLKWLSEYMLGKGWLFFNIRVKWCAQWRKNDRQKHEEQIQQKEFVRHANSSIW